MLYFSQATSVNTCALFQEMHEPVWLSGKALGSIPLRLSFLFRKVVYGHCLVNLPHVAARLNAGVILVMTV